MGDTQDARQISKGSPFYHTFFHRISILPRHANLWSQVISIVRPHLPVLRCFCCASELSAPDACAQKPPAGASARSWAPYVRGSRPCCPLIKETEWYIENFPRCARSILKKLFWKMNGQDPTDKNKFKSLKISSHWTKCFESVSALRASINWEIRKKRDEFRQNVEFQRRNTSLPCLCFCELSLRCARQSVEKRKNKSWWRS